MQAKIMVCLSIMFICFGNLAFANEAIWIRSVHASQTGNVSIVVDLPPGTKAEPSQLRLIEDNKTTATATSISSFSDSDWKLTIVFCIDKSGSIDDRELEKTKNALKSLLRKPLFKKQDRLALVSFENEPRMIQWFTQPKEIYQKINELENMKGLHTVLYDTLYDSLGHVNSDSKDASSPVLKRILVITDGENDGGSRQNTTEVRAQALETGVAIDVVLLHAKQENADTMQSLANDTGGQFVNTDASGIETALNKIFDEILASYVVSFERSIDTTSPKTVRVGVQFQGSDKKLITNSVQTAISQSAIAQPKPPLQEETKEENIEEPIKTNKVVGTSNTSFWWFLVFLLLAVAAAYAIWRSKQKTPGGLTDRKSKVEGDKKISTPAPPSSIPHQTQRKKTLVGTSVSPQQTKTWQAPVESSPSSQQTQRRKTMVGSASSIGSDPDSPIAILTCLRGPLEGQHYSMVKPLFNIGANPDNDLCITQDEYISGDHACLRYENGNLFLTDKGSSNGTFVNDVPVTDTGFILTPGEIFRIGISEFKVTASDG